MMIAVSSILVLLAVGQALGQVGFPTAKCPDGGIVDSSYTVCCPASCKVCNDRACENSPGGPDNCCKKNIISASDTTCRTTGKLPCIGPYVIESRCPAGTISNDDQTVCCDAKCKKCGGPGCTKGCCASNVTKPCFSGARPCVVADKEPKKCAAGLIADPANKRCCLDSCGKCGGPGCHRRKGGAKGCCTGSLIWPCTSRHEDTGCFMESRVCNYSYADCGYPASKTGAVVASDVTACCNYDKTGCRANPDGTDTTTCQANGPDCSQYALEGTISRCGDLQTRYGVTQHTMCCNPFYGEESEQTRCVVDPTGGYRTKCVKRGPPPCEGTPDYAKACGGIALRAENTVCCSGAENCYIDPAFYDGRTKCFKPLRCPPKTVSCGGKIKLYDYDGYFIRREPDTLCCAAGQSCYDQGDGKATVCKTPKTCPAKQTPCGASLTFDKIAAPHTTCCSEAQRCEETYTAVRSFDSNMTSKCVPKKTSGCST